jgi:hypothetical protein
MSRYAEWQEAARRIGPGIRVQVIEDVPTHTIEWQVGIPATLSGGVTSEFDAEYPAVLENQIGEAIVEVRERALAGANAQERINEAVTAERERLSRVVSQLAQAQRALSARAIAPGLDREAAHAAKELDKAAALIAR